jgi:DMSO/TMAO reductase YedYZ molybdopterin-dependent catalytic subunit
VVAYAEATGGTSAPLNATDGPFRATAPGDIKGGRYVSNLVRLDVGASSATTAGVGGGVSSGFAVSGQVSTPMSFDLTALQGLPATSVTVGANTYKGVALWALLNSIGLRLPAGKNASLGMYAVATGSDGYRAAVSLGEIDPGFGNKTALIAYEVNAVPLGANGVARLVMPGEVKQGRSVSNLIAIEVFAAATP